MREAGGQAASDEYADMPGLVSDSGSDSSEDDQPQPAKRRRGGRAGGGGVTATQAGLAEAVATAQAAGEQPASSMPRGQGACGEYADMPGLMSDSESDSSEDDQPQPANRRLEGRAGGGGVASTQAGPTAAAAQAAGKQSASSMRRRAADTCEQQAASSRHRREERVGGGGMSSAAAAAELARLGEGERDAGPGETGRPWASALIVFSGPGTECDLASRLRARGMRVVVVDTKVGGRDHDVLRAEVGDAIVAQVARGEFNVVFIATPSGSYSAAHRPQLRSRRSPLGLLNAPAEWAAYLRKHNQLAEFSQPGWSRRRMPPAQRGRWRTRQTEEIGSRRHGGRCTPTTRHCG